MNYVESVGDLLHSDDVQIVCHQVNCQGAMGAGIAKAIKKLWPIVYEQYSNFINNNCFRDANGSKVETFRFLGLCQVVRIEPGKYVANLFGQDKFGPQGTQYTDYHALEIALYNLKRCILFGELGNIKSIGFPYGLGSGNGGGDWNLIREMIKSVFNDMDITVYVKQLK